MRDSKHHKTSILAGMFGMKMQSEKFGKWKKMFKKILDFVEQIWGFKELDQTALKLMVWPVAQKDMVAHDSYFCQYFASEFNRPWPTQRISGPNFTAPENLNFVGSKGEAIGLDNHWECPLECRPKNHSDWLLC